MKKLCVITATRAEYGLLRPLMRLIDAHKDLQLQTFVTGSHLSPEFGYTYKLIEQDGFHIDAKVEMLLSADTGTSIVKSMGLGLVGFADALDRLKPDAIIILGDRYEMLVMASAASILKIPIVHLHGGEITEGAYDDAFRHAISKLSHLHFTSTDLYRKRVIQMGENPSTVFNVGAIGIDNVMQLNLLSQPELEKQLNITLKKFTYQVTFHPETLSDYSVSEQFHVLLDVIEKQEDSFFVFTKSNADTDGRIINQMIDSYVTAHPEKCCAFHSLGTLRFLSLLKYCTAIVGNSSSGIIEAPSLHTATINIGDRQKGRIQAASVVNSDVNHQALLDAFERVKDSEFTNNLKGIKNPYGEGNTAEKICSVLERTHFKGLLTKGFYDINQ